VLRYLVLLAYSTSAEVHCICICIRQIPVPPSVARWQSSCTRAMLCPSFARKWIKIKS